MDYNDENFLKYLADRSTIIKKIIDIKDAGHDHYTYRLIQENGKQGSSMFPKFVIEQHYAEYLAFKRDNTINNLLDE